MNFTAKIKPNAKANKIVDYSKDAFENYVLKIQIKAVPEKGKANEELIKFLSEIFKKTKKEISIIRGNSSSLKLIEINNIELKDFEDVIKR